ncbi:MAG: histidine kinase N-terminal 7TM domain-containing protein [Anaerolineae bacterium]
MNVQITSYTIITVITAIMMLLVANHIWSRRSGRGIKTFMVLMFGVIWWSLASGFEVMVQDLSAKVVLSSLSYVGITLVPPAWLLFVLEYTSRYRWLTRRTHILLAIQPVLVLIAIATNPLHQLFYTSVELTSNNAYFYAVYEHGPLFWAHAGYAYVLLLLSTGLLLRTFWHSKGLYRYQILLLLIGQFAPWVANMLYLMDASPLPTYMDLTPIAFAITALSAGWNLIRYRLMDITPIAHDVVFEAIDDVVFVLDAKQRIVEINPAGLELLRRPGKDVIGVDASVVFANQAETFYKYHDAEKVDTEIEVMIDDVHHAFRMKISPLRDTQGEVIARIAILQNITELKRINDELRIARDEAIAAKQLADENSRLKSEFLSTMSHELRTPLNAIEGFTSIMLSGMGIQLEERAYDMVERISTNSKRLLALINDFLDLSRIESGRLELVQEAINIKALSKEWQDSVEVLAEEKGIDFVVEVDHQLPTILYSDVDALSKITINLLANAFKFTREGQVKLDIACVDDTSWSISVSDTGIGIPVHAQEYIFDEFRQVDGSSKREFGGTGLGLSLVQKLTRLLGGQVTLESETGKGSVFKVSMPLHITKEQAEQKAIA